MQGYAYLSCNNMTVIIIIIWWTIEKAKIAQPYSYLWYISKLIGLLALFLHASYAQSHHRDTCVYARFEIKILTIAQA